MKRTFLVRLFATFEINGRVFETDGILCDSSDIATHLNGLIEALGFCKFVDFRVESDSVVYRCEDDD